MDLSSTRALLARLGHYFSSSEPTSYSNHRNYDQLCIGVSQFRQMQCVLPWPCFVDLSVPILEFFWLCSMLYPQETVVVHQVLTRNKSKLTLMWSPWPTGKRCQWINAFPLSIPGGWFCEALHRPFRKACGDGKATNTLFGFFPPSLFTPLSLTLATCNHILNKLSTRKPVLLHLQGNWG